MFILVGFIILSFSMLLEHEVGEIGAAKLFIGLAGHVAIGLLVIGILSILLETRHWVEYFKERLAEIVVDSKYLEKLSPESLTRLQTEALKVYFKDEAIAGKDGFLSYYQNYIQEFIGSPFRINVQSDVSITYIDDAKDKVRVHETMSWECKSNGGRIQDSIHWEPNEGEFESVECLEFQISHSDLKGGKRSFEVATFETAWKTPNNGFKYPLQDLIDLDGLVVTIKSDVIVSKNKFLAWRMAHPSRGILLSVRYPPDLTINKELFGLGENCTEILEPGYYKLSSQKWILPNEGIVYELV
jgi:hypothetical protein